MYISEKRKQEFSQCLPLQEFSRILKAESPDFSENGLYEYLIEVSMFHRQIGTPIGQKPTQEQCESWRDFVDVKYESPMSRAKKVNMVNRYLLLYHRADFRLRKEKSPERKRSIDTLEVAEINELISSARKHGKITAAALFDLVFQTACRNDNAHRVLMEDLDHQNKKVYFRKVKGNFNKWVQLSDEAFERLTNYIENQRPKPVNLEDEKYVFISESKLRKIDKSYLRDNLSKFAALAGIEKKVYPHLLRHSRVKDLRDQGWKYEEIIAVTTHRNIMSLQKSYIHMENDDKIRAKLNNRISPTISPASPEIEKKFSQKYDQQIELLQKKIEVMQLELQMTHRGTNKDQASIGYQ